MPVVRESEVESDHIDFVTSIGGRSYKWVSPGLRGVPDRIDLYPVDPAHQAIVAKYVKFTELKRPGKRQTPTQLRRAEELIEMGFEVNCVSEVRP